MPYRLRGDRVEKNEGGRWVLVKRHPNHAKALAHFRALKINVEGVLHHMTRKAK